MIGNFPQAFPDELLYSVCARHVRHLRYPSARGAACELFGTGNALAVIDLPSHLDALVAALPVELGYTAEQLIDEHSLWRYYAPFLSAECAFQLRRDMRRDGGAAIHPRAGIMASTIHLPQRLRWCPACVVEDRGAFGEAYWHRLHQAPGVVVCPQHLALLEETGSVLRSGPRHAFIAADDAVRPVESRLFAPEKDHPLLLRIAEDASWLLRTPGLSSTLAGLRERYLQLLADVDLALPSGRVRARALVAAFVEAYPNDLLILLQCEVDMESGDNWLLRLVRAPSGAQHPLRHFLLMHLLGATAGDFFALTKRAPFGLAPWPCLNQAGDHYGQPLIERCPVTFDRRRGGCPVGHFACPRCGFAYTRGGPDRSPGDRFQRSHIATSGPIWEAALRARWVEPGASIAGVARHLGVDPETAKSHAAAMGLAPLTSNARAERSLRQTTPPARVTTPHTAHRAMHRERWLRELAGGAISATQARAVLPASYMWLYRHDKEWLRATSPPRTHPAPTPRIDWPARDARLAEAVPKAALALRNAPGRPVRVTRAAIGRHLEALALVQKRLDKLPGTDIALGRVVEARGAFAIRRVWWAADCFRRECVRPPRWRLIARAGTGRVAACHQVRAAIDDALQLLEYGPATGETDGNWIETEAQ